MEKEKYFGSVRFYKNLILAAVIIMIVVPSVFAFLYKGRMKRAESEAAVYTQNETDNGVAEISSDVPQRTIVIKGADGELITMVVEDEDK